MSGESSGRPTRHVNVFDEKPPSRARSAVGKMIKENVDTSPKSAKVKADKPTNPEASASRKTVKAKNKATKSDVDREKWKESLPEWLRNDEPKNNKFYHWLWSMHARIFYSRASEDYVIGDDKRRVPKFVDFQQQYWKNYDFTNDTRRLSETKVAVVSASGGMGKTTIASLLAAFRKRATNSPVVVYEGDASDPNLMMWFDLDPQNSLTANQLSAIFDQNPYGTLQYTHFNTWCAVDHESGVMVIHAEEGIFLSANETKRNIAMTKPNVHTFIGDTQPGLFDSNAATYGQIEEADIVIVAGMGTGSKGRNEIRTTLDYKPYNLRDENNMVSSRVIIVVNDVDPRDFNSRTRYQFAERYNALPSQVVLIPHSNYLKGSRNSSKDDKINKIRIRSLDARTRYAVSYLDRKVTELAIVLNTAKAEALGSAQQEMMYHSTETLDQYGFPEEHSELHYPHQGSLHVSAPVGTQ